MKKYSHIINIAMVIIGIIGMLIYYFSERERATATVSVVEVKKEKEPAIPTETITVAVASRELTKGSRLTASDFKLKTITIAQGSNERAAFSVEKNLDSWIIKSDIVVDSYIPVSALVAPGTEEYIAISAKPGSIVYGFSINNSDSYLFTNIAPGESVDIYLSYQLREDIRENGVVDVTPTMGTSDEINSKHLKLIMKDKKVLAISNNHNRLSETVSKEDPLKKEGYILVELAPDEVKTLKGLDGAKFYIFPGELDSDKLTIRHSALVGDEGQWPIDNRDILSVQSRVGNNNQEEKVKEIRGDK